MKLLVTGASGFVAGEVIPLLRDRGFDLTLVTARPEAIAAEFSGLTCISYDQIDAHLPGMDAVLHLAARNNTADGDLAAFRAVNVDQTMAIFRAARAAGVGKFLFASSFHTLALRGPTGPYAVTKAEAEDSLRAETGMEVHILHMAAIYGSSFRGKLSVLNGWPKPLQRMALTTLGALRPTVHVARVAERVAEILQGEASAPHYLYEPAQDNPVYRVGKRLLDLAFAAAIFVLIGWLLVIVWLLIRFDSPGGGLFAQDRVGRFGRIFTCYKFRTMRQGTVQAGTHEVGAAAVTRIGHFLRKTKLDEMPQIYNILRNDLSLIGPRPCLPNQTELVARRTELGVLEVKPGISGLAQIQDIDMSDPDRLARVDALYVALQCLPLDLKIAVATATGSGQGDKVRQGESAT